MRWLWEHLCPTGPDVRMTYDDQRAPNNFSHQRICQEPITSELPTIRKSIEWRFEMKCGGPDFYLAR